MSGWRSCPLGDVATLQRGFDLPSRMRRRGAVPIVSSSGVSGWHDRAMAKAPGVVTGRYGTIGDVFFQNIDFWPLNTTLWVSDFHGNDERFVYYMLQRVNYAAHSGKSGVPGVNRNDLHTEVMLLPVSTAEQRRIASALVDCDELVATLERLIAKKQAIKQGMMQQLLTGRTRLPGFETLWSDSAIADLAQIVSGGTPQSSVPVYWDGGIAWCTPTDITREPGRFLRRTERTISQEGLERSAARLLPVGSLLLCTRATIGEVKIATTPIATNQGFKSLVPRAGVSGEYLYYKILTLKDKLAAKGTGSTFLEVSRRDIASLTFCTPSYDEQMAIADVLSDSDNEIEVLQRRLAKARSTKTGMMQQLLPGKTRLPVQEAAS
jgi:type I restriction enzyme, S subunit